MVSANSDTPARPAPPRLSVSLPLMLPCCGFCWVCSKWSCSDCGRTSLSQALAEPSHRAIIRPPHKGPGQRMLPPLDATTPYAADRRKARANRDAQPVAEVSLLRGQLLEVLS